MVRTISVVRNVHKKEIDLVSVHEQYQKVNTTIEGHEFLNLVDDVDGVDVNDDDDDDDGDVCVYDESVDGNEVYWFHR